MVWHYGPLAFAALSWSAVFLWIRRERQRQRRRRGGYIRPPVSSTTNRPTAGARGISFSLPPRLGLASAVEVGPATPPAPNNMLVHLRFGSVTGGARTGLTPRESAAYDDGAA